MLKDIQQQFAELVLNQSSDFSFVASPQPAECIHIYRQTILENIRNCLSIKYPGIWELLGKDCADSVARAFVTQAKQLPKTGCLDDFGDEFPAYLGQIPELQHLYYLSDYATYELFKARVYSAVDMQCIELAQLQAYPDSKKEDVCLSFIDACVLYYSNYPIDVIESTISAPNHSTVTLPNHGAYVLIARPEHQVISFWLKEDLWLFINYLYQGLSLGKALDRVWSQFIDFDISYALYFIFEKKLIKSLGEANEFTN